jgi:hypothetical protein
MSRRKLPETEVPLASTTALRDLLAEVAQLGVEFRFSGASVVINGLEQLPAPLRRELERHQQSGRLWDYLGGWSADAPAIAFADQLGVHIRLVETPTDCRAAIRQLIVDVRQYVGHIAVDVETTPRAGHTQERTPIKLKLDGGVHAVQSAPVSRKDRTTLDPHRARIAMLQLYAGGDTCFLFRGEALRLVAGSRWLRRQYLVVHNAGFEASFLQQHAPAKSPVPRRSGRFECSMQAAGLVIGVDFNGSGRSLATTVEKLLGLTMPKELATSDWGAATLSPGQQAYAGTDSVCTWRLWPLLAEQLRVTGCQAAYELQRGVIPVLPQPRPDGSPHQTPICSSYLAAGHQSSAAASAQPPGMSWLRPTGVRSSCGLQRGSVRTMHLRSCIAVAKTCTNRMLRRSPALHRTQ